MTRRTLYIHEPYIEKIDNKVRLCARVEKVNGDSTLYYEVSEDYGEYLVTDRLDAFVVGLLHEAMRLECDIVTEVGITEQLYFQLTNFYIPVLAQNMSDMHEINIQAKRIAAPVENIGAVGTGNSGGVDSLYTILKYSDCNMGKYKLTHVLFNNVSTADDDDARIRRQFEKDIPERKKVADELHLKFITLYTNLYAFYEHPGIFNHYFTLQYLSTSIALGKLFATYYFSSTWPVAGFSMDEHKIVSGARWDLFTLDCASTENLKFYSTGAEVDRVGKMNYILPTEIAQKYLQVCSIEQSPGGYEYTAKINCGYCNKCRRTIIFLHTKKMLDNYKDIFDLSYFEQNSNKFIGQGLAADQRAFSKQMIKELKSVHQYNWLTKVWYLFYRIRYGLAKNVKLVYLYHSVSRLARRRKYE